MLRRGDGCEVKNGGREGGGDEVLFDTPSIHSCMY